MGYHESSKLGMAAKNTVFLLLALFGAFMFTTTPADAHRFNVALVVPLSNAASAEGRQVRDGFMLATTERDSHPDEESDGHLGGLDIYVTVIDEQGDITADIERIGKQGKIDIVVAFGSHETRTMIAKVLDGKKIALLTPARSPFAKSGTPAVAAFVSAYKKAHGSLPSAHAAQGYNAARRIDVAVRAQGSADDKTALRKSFGETAHGFNW